MRRVGRLALVALVVASSLTAVATPAAANDAFVAVDVEASPDPAQPGTNVTVTTTVENVYDDGSPYRLQRVTLRETEMRDSSQYDSRTPSTVVGAGDSVRVNLSEEFGRTGEFVRYVHVKLISGDGQVVNLVRPVTVTVQQSHPSMSLSADEPSQSENADFSLTVANGLPDTVRGLTVEFDSDDVSFTENRRVVSSLDPGNQATVTVPARNVSAGKKSVAVQLSYLTADGESRSVARTLSTTIEDEGRPAQIEFTGLRVSQNGDELVVRGSTSNVGSSNASSVLVSVGDGEAVAPAQNQATYFVGEVKASDYSSFEVHADLATDGNGTVSIPLQVGYNDDGERVTRTAEVDFTPNARVDDATARQSPAAPALPAAIGGLLVLVVGGLGWRRFR